MRMTTAIGHDEPVEVGRRHRRALDGGEHRDGRGDHAVAVEERGAEQAEQHEDPPAAAHGWTSRGDQRGEREDPALAVVVGPHDEGQVLEGDHERSATRR